MNVSFSFLLQSYQQTATSLKKYFTLNSYRNILQLVKPWYDEVKDYRFPYPQECNPRCPMRCYGPVCTHYTQVKMIVIFCLTFALQYFIKQYAIIIDNDTFIVSDGLGNIQQNRMCNPYLQPHECLGSQMAECCLPCVQLFSKVSAQIHLH